MWLRRLWLGTNPFGLILVGLFVLFFLIMVVVVVIANSRQSGVTGIDPAEIQRIRYERAHCHSS